MKLLKLLTLPAGLWVLVTGAWVLPDMIDSAARGEWHSWGPLLYTGLTLLSGLALMGWYFWYVLVAEMACLKRRREDDHDRS